MQRTYCERGRLLFCGKYRDQGRVERHVVLFRSATTKPKNTRNHLPCSPFIPLPPSLSLSFPPPTSLPSTLFFPYVVSILSKKLHILPFQCSNLTTPRLADDLMVPSRMFVKCWDHSSLTFPGSPSSVRQLAVFGKPPRGDKKWPQDQHLLSWTDFEFQKCALLVGHQFVEGTEHFVNFRLFFGDVSSSRFVVVDVCSLYTYVMRTFCFETGNLEIYTDVSKTRKIQALLNH